MRVVVVDNDPDALDLVATDLALAGHLVVGRAADGDGALEVCLRERPDVLVVDYRIPTPDGVAVAREVARLLPDTRVVVYSNYQSAVLADQVRAAGAVLVAKGNIRRLRRTVTTKEAP
jgi:DNA-binding NarL/FixJ family response regulator